MSTPKYTRFVYSLWIAALLVSCASTEPKKKLTITEQIAEDNHNAKDLWGEFQKSIQFANLPETEKFLTEIARKISWNQEGLQESSIHVRIHNVSKSEQSFFYSFPGTEISIPLKAVKKMEYENEIAAGIAYELANVVNRHLGHKVEKGAQPILFGPGNLFVLEREDRLASIKLGTKLLYLAGYDLRGMVSLFQRYPEFFGGLSDKKEVEFNMKESQRVRSDFLPAKSPVVRSPEFIRLKKLLNQS